MAFDVNAVRQIGKYPVERFLAEGGMAWVFRVNDPDLFNAPRALKLLKPQAAEGEDYQRFLAEAQILATIQHPNLIHVYDFGQDAETGCHYYTMDYIEGRTLEEVPPDWLDEVDEEDEEADDEAPEVDEADPNATSFIHVQKPTAKTRHTVRDICEYFSGVLAALARLHRENVVHRDIKPENIFLTHDGIAVLGDLGIATGRHSRGITEVGRVPGTPLYMSPEHARGETSTVRSDVFSLGLSIYSVLSGETIYEQTEGVDATDGSNVLRYLLALYDDDEEFDFVFHESVPDVVCDVIEKACKVHEEDRYATADEFNEALRDAIDGVSHRGPGGVRPGVAIAVALPIVALIGYFAVQTILGSEKAVIAEEAAAEVLALGSNMNTLIDNLAALEDGPNPDLIERVRTALKKAKQDAAAGRTELDDNEYDVAQQMFVRARTGYQSICNNVSTGFLGQAAPPRVRSALSVREQVEPAAEQIVPRDWKALSDLTAKLEQKVPERGCDRAHALWEQIATASLVVARSAELSAEMNRRLPEVSAAAIASAEEARGGARASRTVRSEYKALMDVASAQLEKAKNSGAASNYSVAIREAKRSKSDFDRAAGVRPAFEARANSRDLMAKIDREGISVDALRAKEQEANQFWADGEFGEAAVAYRALLAETNAIYSAASRTLVARNDALAAREDAEGWAVPVRLLSDAEALYSDGIRKLRSEEYEAAEAIFRDALSGFRDAKRQAVDEGLIDPNADTAEALQLARSRAEEAERKRLADETRRETERREAATREAAARQELEDLKVALEKARNSPSPKQVAATAAELEDAKLRKVMKDYETAYESRSIEDLNRIWSMAGFERLQIQRLFDDCDQIRLQVSIDESNVTGNSARVDYDETIVFKECEKTRAGSRYSELSASLARRGENWQIKTIRPR